MRNVNVLLFASALALSGAVQADLPDFTALVERNAPAVVNITARKEPGTQTDPSELYGEEVPEIFRRFFGPNHPPIDGRESVSGGSGFIISADGYLLTNHHVVDGADQVTVRLKDRRQLRAKVIGSDPQSDIALLKLDAKDLPTVTLGDSNELKPGQWVVAIGSPFNFDYSVTAGIVSAKGRSFSAEQRFVPFIQTDVAINRGNSGGPLFNLDGEVVGINSQIFSNTGGYIGLSFAIPIEVAKSVVEQIKTTGHVSRGSLGVRIQEVTADNAEALGIPRVGGALVVEVTKGSAAEKAGLKVGDLITTYNGHEIGSSSELPPMVGASTPGSKATVGILRDGKAMTVPVTVGELPGEVAAAAATEPSKEVAAADNPLGVAVRELSSEEREQLGLESNEGVLVERVTGPEARRAGLQPGSIVLRVGRERVGSVEQFDGALEDIAPGQVAMMLVRQGENTGFITIRRPSAKG